MTEQTISYGKNCEYDKPLTNNFVISKTHQENKMDKERNDSFEMEQNGMTITFVFPPATRKEDSVKETMSSEKSHHVVPHTEEIKSILATILPEYLAKGGISP